MSEKTLTPSGATILVVDDNPVNLQLIVSLLREFGHSIRAATSGDLALQAARLSPPDLILLDVRMPKMDGYELCRELKADSRLQRIPVIFLSANHQTEEKVKAFAVGGVDYVTKPFEPEEMRVRIGIQLEIHRLQQENERQRMLLEETVRRRTRQLEEANTRLAGLSQAKSSFLAAIAHELRTPLNSLLGAAELAFSMSTRHPEMAEYHQMFESSRQQLLRLLEDAILLSQIQAQEIIFHQDPCPLDLVLSAASGELDPAKFPRPPLPAGLGLVTGDRELLTEALTRLLEITATFSRTGPPLLVTGAVEANEVTLTFQMGNGPVPAADINRSFAPLLSGTPLVPDGELGLSPAVAGQIIRLSGGRMEILPREPEGLQLQVTLPRANQ